jgi:hypothetical protein
LALYFIHLLNGQERILDKAGVELDGLPAVKAQALREARAIIAADAIDGVIDLGQRIEVQDSSGKAIYKLDLADAVTIERRLARGESDPAGQE